jgi:hypothetical protein
MRYVVEIGMEDFEAWSGGLDTLTKIIEQDKCDELENYLNMIFSDKIPTETEINDELWFDSEGIFRALGIEEF